MVGEPHQNGEAQARDGSRPWPRPIPRLRFELLLDPEPEGPKRMFLELPGAPVLLFQETVRRAWWIFDDRLHFLHKPPVERGI